MKIIATNKAPAAIGAYSQAVLANNTLYVSGQIPFVAETMKCIDDHDVALQAKQCLANIKAIVEAADLKIENVVKCNIFVTDMNDFATVNEQYSTFFGNHKPARAFVQVAGLPRGVKVEIEAIAVKE